MTPYGKESSKNDLINIVIADDHPLILTGLRHIIEKEPGLAVVGEAGNGQIAVELIRTLLPHIAILDLEMPILNGLEAAKRSISEKLPASIIVLTMYDDEIVFNEVMDSGVFGYVLKDSAAMDIIKAIHTVLRGEYFISSTLSTYALKSRQNRSTKSEFGLGLHALSPSERRILKLVAQEKGSIEIAELLSISQRTVDNHRTNICRKLRLNGVNSLLRFAIKHRTEL